MCPCFLSLRFPFVLPSISDLDLFIEATHSHSHSQSFLMIITSNFSLFIVCKHSRIHSLHSVHCFCSLTDQSKDLCMFDRLMQLINASFPPVQLVNELMHSTPPWKINSINENIVFAPNPTIYWKFNAIESDDHFSAFFINIINRTVQTINFCILGKNSSTKYVSKSWNMWLALFSMFNSIDYTKYR